LINRKQVSADLLYAPRDSVAVLGSQDFESLQDHQRQCALPDVRFLLRHVGFQKERCHTFSGKATGRCVAKGCVAHQAGGKSVGLRGSRLEPRHKAHEIKGTLAPEVSVLPFSRNLFSRAATSP
jgi:hypothetical protein